MDREAKKILWDLVDKYEASKTFIGENKVNQSFTVHIAKLFPKYADDADYDTFSRINLVIQDLEREELVRAKRKSNGIVTGVNLNEERLETIYGYLERKPKAEEHAWLEEILRSIVADEKAPELLRCYAKEQRSRIEENKKVEGYSGDRKEFLDILKAAVFALKNERECYIRNVSMNLFQDSKRLEALKSKVQTLLYQYGDFGDRESVLEELGVVKTPTYIMMKGKGDLILNDQILKLCELRGDVAFSTKSVGEISRFRILGNRLVTIENLTTFHEYSNPEDFCIYLGGFHNQLKQQVIKRIYEQNPDKEYVHFGDIDGGGFCIYDHLRRKTGIPFLPVFMDVETLEKYQRFWAPLTENDRRRLVRLEEDPEFAVFHPVIGFMLRCNCKLEQEAVGG